MANPLYRAVLEVENPDLFEAIRQRLRTENGAPGGAQSSEQAPIYRVEAEFAAGNKTIRVVTDPVYRELWFDAWFPLANFGRLVLELPEQLRPPGPWRIERHRWRRRGLRFDVRFETSADVLPHNAIDRSFGMPGRSACAACEIHPAEAERLIHRLKDLSGGSSPRSPFGWPTVSFPRLIGSFNIWADFDGDLFEIGSTGLSGLRRALRVLPLNFVLGRRAWEIYISPGERVLVESRENSLLLPLVEEAWKRV